MSAFIHASEIEERLLRPTNTYRLARLSLVAGMAVPFLYYGAQLVAAPFYPGYSFMSEMASTLGSRAAVHPSIWNAGMLLVGTATLLAVPGLLYSLRQLGARPVLAWSSAGCLFNNALLSFASAIYPLEDPRHNGGPLVIGTLLLPWLFSAVVWRREAVGSLRLYFIASGVAVLVLAPIMGQAVALGIEPFGGILQRVLTFSMFPPIGVMAWYLNRANGLRFEAFRTESASG
jgi:hypothetical protein